MCTVALKQELNQTIDSLSDDSVRLLIEVARHISSGDSTRERNQQSRASAVKQSALGALAGGLLYMADDFDDTPDCFKEYI